MMIVGLDSNMVAPQVSQTLCLILCIPESPLSRLYHSNMKRTKALLQVKVGFVRCLGVEIQIKEHPRYPRGLFPCGNVNFNVGYANPNIINLVIG